MKIKTDKFFMLVKMSRTWIGGYFQKTYSFLGSGDKSIKINRGIYYLFGASILLFSYLVANGYFFEGEKTLVTIPSFFYPIEVKLNMLIWAVLIYFVVKSYIQIEPNEVGSLVFLGKALYNIYAGPHVVWKFFAKVVFGPRTRQQREFPADSSLIHYGEGSAPEGKVEPFRITTDGKPDLKEGDDPLESRLTLDVSFFTAFRISDMTQFAKVIGFNEIDLNGKKVLIADIVEAFRQLQDTAKRVLNQEFAIRTPGTIIKDQGVIAGILAKTLDELVRDSNIAQERWGIDLQEVAITNVGLSHTLNTALSAIPKALFDAKVAIAAGFAEAKVIFLKGEQTSLVKKLTLIAEAEGLESIAARLKITDKAALSALLNAKFTETALGSVGENGKLVIVGGSGGVQNLLGLLEANK